MAGFKQWHAIVTSGSAMPDVVPNVVAWLNSFQDKHSSPQSDYGLDADGGVFQYFFASVWIPDTKEMTLVYSDKGATKLGLETGIAHNMVVPAKQRDEEFLKINQQLNDSKNIDASLTSEQLKLLEAATAEREQLTEQSATLKEQIASLMSQLKEAEDARQAMVSESQKAQESAAAEREKLTEEVSAAKQLVSQLKTTADMADEEGFARNQALDAALAEAKEERVTLEAELKKANTERLALIKVNAELVVSQTEQSTFLKRMDERLNLEDPSGVEETLDASKIKEIIAEELNKAAESGVQEETSSGETVETLSAAAVAEIAQKLIDEKFQSSGLPDEPMSIDQIREIAMDVLTTASPSDSE